MTALHIAADNGHLQCMQLLLDRGVDAQGEEGQKALRIAARQGHFKCLELLLDRGADIHAQDGMGQTALHLAADKGILKCLQLLLNRGADIHDQDVHGNTALHIAAREGNLKCLQLLLDNGAYVKGRDSFGNTALKWAPYKGEDPTQTCWYLLLKHGACPHELWRGHTFLYRAVIQGNITQIKLLLSLGADPLRDETGQGDSPLQVAQTTRNLSEEKRSRIIDLLTGKEAVDIPWDPSPVPWREPNQPDRGLLIIPQSPRDLKHITRQTIRSHLLAIKSHNLSSVVPRLPLPECIKNYLLFKVSWE